MQETSDKHPEALPELHLGLESWRYLRCVVVSAGYYEKSRDVLAKQLCKQILAMSTTIPRLRLRLRLQAVSFSIIGIDHDESVPCMSILSQTRQGVA